MIRGKIGASVIRQHGKLTGAQVTLRGLPSDLLGCCLLATKQAWWRILPVFCSSWGSDITGNVIFPEPVNILQGVNLALIRLIQQNSWRRLEIGSPSKTPQIDLFILQHQGSSSSHGKWWRIRELEPHCEIDCTWSRSLSFALGLLGPTRAQPEIHANQYGGKAILSNLLKPRYPKIGWQELMSEINFKCTCSLDSWSLLIKIWSTLLMGDGKCCQRFFI